MAMGSRTEFPEGRINAAEEILGPPLAAGLGDRPALIWNADSLSYRQLEKLTNRYGNAFRAAGVEPGNRVLFLMDDSPDLVAAYLGAMKIGAVPVAFNLRATAAELQHVIEDSRCAILIIEDAFLDVFEAIQAGLSQRPRVVVWGERRGDYPGTAAFVEGRAEELDYLPMAVDDMAFWLYTSGTTGRPKGVVHLQHDITVADLHLCRSLGVKPGDRIFTTSKLFFAFALGHSFFGGLRAGATVLLYHGWPEARPIIEFIDRERPDLLFSVPAFYRNLMHEGACGHDAFRRIRHCVSAGEKLPGQLFERWLEGTGVPILEGIGTSETVFLFIANTPDRMRPGATGRPLPWTEARLVDDQGRTVTEPDTPGVLCVKMGSVFDRYWNQQDRTRAAFCGDGWYRTGDMFMFDAAGWWYHCGRADDMLKVSGQWVSPAEIEECVLTVPRVAEAAVVGSETEDGLTRTTLFVVAGNGVDTAILADSIRETLTSRLSVYKCPRNIHFLDAIPRTSTGKVQRYKLRRMLTAARSR